jgi:hypothetical protein
MSLTTLEPLVGRWVTTITMLHPPEAKGQVYHAIDTYRWLAGKGAMVHEVEARMGEDTINSIEVYHADGDRIVSRNFDGRGEVSDYVAQMRDGVWTVEGESERLTSRLTADGLVEGLWRLKVEGDWVDWMTVRLVRVA